MDAILPVELWREVLLHLSMPSLQLLKAVCKAMAQLCRAVLRSEAWQTRTPLNEFALRESIKTQVHTYRLPLTVSFYPHFLPEDAQCIATVHRLKLMFRNNTTEELVQPVDASQFGFKKMYDSNIHLVPYDMCIEVHGEGVYTSESSLRQLLQRVLRMRGNNEALRGGFADSLWNFCVDTSRNDATIWPFEWTQNEDEESFKGIFSSMCPVTQIRKNKWIDHQAPWSQLGNCEYETMSLEQLCATGLRLFV